MIQLGKGLGVEAYYVLLAVPQATSGTKSSDRLFSPENSIAVWKGVREQWVRWDQGNTFKYQSAIQHPNVPKASLFTLGFEKHMARPVDENVDRVMGLEDHAQVSQWVTLEHRRVCTLICRETGIEVRVLLESDACTIFVTAKVPQNF